ncbi:hypothetical protein SEA_SHAM_200 [Streptomyces phage Sham]|nr:hypothetical protein SEA_SHAM_200 [Streptomyces phage Sham]
MLTKRDAAVISVYTGHLMGELSDTIEYMNELAGSNPDKDVMFSEDDRQEVCKEEFMRVTDALPEKDKYTITAYTKIATTAFGPFQTYAENLLGMSVWTHEFMFPPVWWALHEKSAKAWAELSENLTD